MHIQGVMITTIIINSSPHIVPLSVCDEEYLRSTLLANFKYIIQYY